MEKINRHYRKGTNRKSLSSTASLINKSTLRNKFLPAIMALTFSLLSLTTYYLIPNTVSSQQSLLGIQFSPNNAQLKTGEEKIISIKLDSPEKISALDLKFTTSGSLQITDFRDSINTNNNLNAFEYKLVKKDLTTTNPGVSYILTTANLPDSVTIYLKIKGSITGEAKLSIDYNKSQVISKNGSLLQITPNQAAVFALNQTFSSADFINLNTLPQINYPSSAAQINLKLKLYGALPNSVTNLKGLVVAVGRNGETDFETIPQQINLNQNPDGTFSGRVVFPDFQNGTNFSLMIKIDKYLLRRICNMNPTENNPSGYVCTDPGLTIRKGQNTFDFSKVALLPGDLGQIDGLLNAYDLSVVRNNLGKADDLSLALADLNYDGIVDIKDFEIITRVADNTNRKADN